MTINCHVKQNALTILSRYYKEEKSKNRSVYKFTFYLLSCQIKKISVCLQKPFFLFIFFKIIITFVFDLLNSFIFFVINKKCLYTFIQSLYL